MRGQEWAWRYYHIRTPDTAGNSEMFRYDLTGYSYGIAQPISFTWVGYLYSGNRRLIQARAVTNHPQKGVGVSHYQGSDGHLYLKFGPNQAVLHGLCSRLRAAQRASAFNTTPVAIGSFYA